MQSYLQDEQQALLKRIASLETIASDQNNQLAATDRTVQRRLSESRRQPAASQSLLRNTSAQDTLRSKLSKIEGELTAAKM